MRICPGGGQRVPGELAHGQGQPPQSMRTVHSNAQKVKQVWQKASMDKCEAPDLRSNTTKKYTEGRSEDRLLGRKTKDTACTYRNGVRKAKAYLRLKLAGQETGSKTGFCKYTISKGKAKENVGPLLSGAWELATSDRKRLRTQCLLCLSFHR